MGDLSLTVVSLSRLPAGKVLTVVERDRAVVWLRGEIDLAVAYDLHEICRHAARLGPVVVIDMSGMTFCDSTLVNFVRFLGEQHRVSLRNPPRRYLELLGLCQVELDLVPEPDGAPIAG